MPGGYIDAASGRFAAGTGTGRDGEGFGAGATGGSNPGGYSDVFGGVAAEG